MRSKFLKIVFINLIFVFIYDISEAGMKRDIALIRLELELDVIPSLLISDAFTPMTHFNKNDFQFSATPVYLNLPLGNDKKIENQRDDLNCKAISFNSGYALTDRSFANLFYSYANISGTVGYDEDGSPLVRIDGEQTIQSYMASAGYDLWETNETSIPLMFGIGQRFIKMDMDVRGIWYPSDCVVQSDSSSILYFLGIAYSRKFSIFNADFKLTPYLYYFSTGSPVFKFSSEGDPSFNYSEKGLDGETLVDGFHFSYLVDGLGFTLSVNSEYAAYYYNSFDNLLLDGMHMLYIGIKEFAYTFTISYTI